MVASAGVGLPMLDEATRAVCDGVAERLEAEAADLAETMAAAVYKSRLRCWLSISPSADAIRLICASTWLMPRAKWTSSACWLSA